MDTTREVHIYRVGDIVTVYGYPCRVYRVRPFGTYDVERIDGSGRCYRLTGLTRY